MSKVQSRIKKTRIKKLPIKPGTGGTGGTRIKKLPIKPGTSGNF